MHGRVIAVAVAAATATLTLVGVAAADGNCTADDLSGTIGCTAGSAGAPATSNGGGSSHGGSGGSAGDVAPARPASQEDKGMDWMWTIFCAKNPTAPQCQPDKGGEAPARETPATLAQQAMSKLNLPLPSGSVSPEQKLPDGRLTTFVQIPTWFRVDPAQWRPVTTRAESGPIFAEATATPVRLHFNPGNGEAPGQCAGPGTRWLSDRNTAKDREPGSCDVILRKSSFGLPNGQSPAELSVVWHVTWKGSGGTSGDLGEIARTKQFPLAISEAQAVITN